MRYDILLRMHARRHEAMTALQLIQLVLPLLLLFFLHPHDSVEALEGADSFVQAAYHPAPPHPTLYRDLVLP